MDHCPGNPAANVLHVGDTTLGNPFESSRGQRHPWTHLHTDGMLCTRIFPA